MTTDTRARIDSLWDLFWAGGLTNPLTITEQLTYLLFLRMLDENTPEIFADGYDDCRWQVLRSYDADTLFRHMHERVFPFLRGLDSQIRFMQDALFLVPSARLLAKAMEITESICGENDLMGDIYEYLLSRISSSGTNGQFRTPRHIIRLMTCLTQPASSDTICDPAMGTAGFLCEAARFIREHEPDTAGQRDFSAVFSGFDTDRTMLRIGAMNMLLHGIQAPQTAWADSLSEDFPRDAAYSLILANPPFTGTLDQERIAGDLRTLSTRKTELLFLALIMRILKPNGRCAVIVPDGVLFGNSRAHRTVRRTLVEDHRLRAVISMPGGVFRPYAGISTSVLLFEKTGRTSDVWFYGMESDGFSLDDKRFPVPENDIPDILRRFHDPESEMHRGRTERSFFVPREEIAANDYLLTISRYRHADIPAAVYPPSEELIAQLLRTEEEISRTLQDALRKASP